MGALEGVDTMPKTDKEYEIERDAQVLVDRELVKADPKRWAAAIAHIKKENSARAAAVKKENSARASAVKK